MKSKLLGILMVAIAAACVAGAAKEGSREALIGGLAAAAIFLFLAFRFFRKPSAGKNKAAAPQKATPEAPTKSSKFAFVSFNVAGTTFKNDDRSDRQVILRHIKFQDPPYVQEGADSLDVELIPYEYKGEPAYYVKVNGYTIGNVPSAKVAEVTAALEHPDAVISTFDVTGGGTHDGEKYNYGATVAVRYTP